LHRRRSDDIIKQHFYQFHPTNEMSNRQDFDHSQPVLKRVVSIHQSHAAAISRHQHCDCEFIYLRSGRYRYRHNDYTGELAPGQGFLLRPGDWHIDYLEAGTIYTAVNFIIRNDDFSFLRPDAAEPQLIVTDNSGSIVRIIDALEQENEKADVFAIRLKTVYLQELYWQYLRLLPRETVAEKLFGDEEREKLTRDLQRVALRHLQNFVTLPELAAQLCVTPRTLNNRCRQCFGMSPLKAILKIRMEMALEMLTRTGMSVKEVSDYLGFSNPYHFSKVFRRIFAVTPTSCKKKTGPRT